jgi:hypothetical protein
MKWAWIQLMMLSTGLVPRIARAQAVNPPLLSGVPGGGGQEIGWSSMVASIAIVAGAVLLFLAIGAALDFRRKRAEQVMELEARIVGALMEHRELVRSSVGPTVRIPFWRGTPATVEMSGAVSSASVAALAIRIAEQEASRVRPDAVIENRVIVSPSSGPRAAGAERELHTADRLVVAIKTLTAVVTVLTAVGLLKYAAVIEHLPLK